MSLLLCCALPLFPARAPADQPAAFIKAGSQPWRPLPVQSAGATVSVTVEPSQTDHGRALLLIDPPKGMVINDARPPRVTGLWIDAKPKAPGAPVWLGRGGWQVGTVVVAARDAENALAPETARFEVDGVRYGLGARRVSRVGEAFRLTVPAVDYGKHRITFTVSDSSPLGNEVTQEIGWERFDPTDFALAAMGAKLTADSFFPGYPDLASLQDGRTDLTGEHCQNDVSWASAETPVDHWVEVDLSRSRQVHEVTLYWAYYSGVYHTAKAFRVEVPAGSAWRTAWQTPAEGLQAGKLTTAAFGPVEASRVRVVQPAGAGSPERPNLMWLAEVAVR